MPGSTPIEPLPVGSPPLVGEVVEFDEDRGIGLVQVGDRAAPFHCTAITDGSRRLEVGTVVAVRLGAGHLGRTEARTVRPLPGVAGRGPRLRPAAPAPAASGQVTPGLALGPVPRPPRSPASADDTPASADVTPPSGTPSVGGPAMRGEAG
jgi:cold shock CspA family protein